MRITFTKRLSQMSYRTIENNHPRHAKRDAELGGNASRSFYLHVASGALG